MLEKELARKRGHPRGRGTNGSRPSVLLLCSQRTSSTPANRMASASKSHVRQDLPCEVAHSRTPEARNGQPCPRPSPFGLDCRSASLSFVVWLHARCPPPKRQSSRHRGVCLTSDRPSHQVRTSPMLSRTKARASAPSQTLIRIWPHVLRRSKPPFFAGCPNWGTSLTWELGGDSRCRVPLTGQWGSPRQLVRIAVV